jgi:hypothetical protein
MVSTNDNYKLQYTFLSFSVHRQWSNRVSLAYKMIMIIPFFWFILLVHRIILYRIEDGICGPPDGFYEYYDNYFQVIFSSVSPVIVMFILAYLLIKNVREVSRRRIVPANGNPIIINSRKTIIHQIDAQLTIMLTLESLITIITYAPYATQLIYANITQNWSKTPLRLAWESVFTELIHLFSYVFFATSFYVSIISNNGFRREIKRLLKINTSSHPEIHAAAIIHQ